MYLPFLVQYFPGSTKIPVLGIFDKPGRGALQHFYFVQLLLRTLTSEVAVN